jgi:hypothetical protein
MGAKPGATGRHFDEIERLATEMDEIGAKAIQPALAIETPMTDRLRAVMARPTMQELWGNVKRKLADQGDEIGLSTRTQAIHRMKMELDGAIGMSKRAEKVGNKPGAGWDARTLTILKHDLLNAVDNPAYKAGLRKYANTAQLRNALEDGYESFKTLQPEQIIRTLRELDSDMKRRFWRYGAMRKVSEEIKAGNASRDRTENVFGSPAMQMKLRAIMPSRQAFREFQRSLLAEARMADTRKAVQGNSTTAKQLTQMEEAAQPARAVSAIANAAAGRFEPVLNWMGRNFDRYSGGLTPAVSRHIIDMSLSRDPVLMQGIAERALRQAEEVPAARARLVKQLMAGYGAAQSAAMPTESANEQRKRALARQLLEFQR